MKLNKSLILLFILSVFICISGISASDVDVSGNQFTVPDGYSVNTTLVNSTILVKDNDANYTIYISAGELSDFEIAKNSREISGFKFLAEDNYTSESNLTVNQQNFIKNESFYSFYSFSFNGADYLITYSFPVDDEFNGEEDNPVNVIVNGLS